MVLDDFSFGKTPKKEKICKLPLECLCYVCGEFNFAEKVRKMTETLKDAYLQYFGFAAESIDEIWAPKSVCSTCSATLNKWAGGGKVDMPFATPMIWRNPIDHVTDCYFCLTTVSSGRGRKVIHPDQNVQRIHRKINWVIENRMNRTGVQPAEQKVKFVRWIRPN